MLALRDRYVLTETDWNHYRFHHRDRLASSLRYSDELSITYGYDHSGARVRMKDATTTSYFGKLYQQTNGGYKKTKNIYVGSQLVATIEKQGTAAVIPYYVLSDNLSSVTMLTNSAGVATQTLDYLPFGGVRVNSKNTSFNSQRKYIGQLMDSSTNLDYLNARYYDGNRGQFTSQDPLSRNIGLNPTDRLLLNPQEQNMYSYALNNPIRLSDPSGEAVSLSQLINTFNSQVNALMASLNSFFSSSGGSGNSTPNMTPLPPGQSKQNPTGGGGGGGTTVQNVIPNSAWSPQSSPTGCYLASIDCAGYTPSPEKFIQIAALQNGKMVPKASAGKGVNSINENLQNKKPVIVGIGWDLKPDDSADPSSRYNNATDHYITVVGAGVDGGRQYYNFFDSATSNKENGTSPQNRLYLNADGTLAGTSVYTPFSGAQRTYIVTEVRPQ